VPDSAHLPALIMARRTGLSWIANWNDPPLMPSFMGHKNAKHINFRQHRFLETVGREANLHTFPTERMKNYMMQFLGRDAEMKSSVIPHLAFSAAPILQRDTDLFLLCHAGNIFAGRFTEAFFSAFSKFLAQFKLTGKCYLDIIGKTEDSFKELAEDYQITSSIRYHGSLSYAETVRALGRYSVLVLFESPYSEGIFLPAKLVDYVSAGRPILGVSPKVGTMRDIISKHGGGMVADCTDKEDIYFALTHLYEAWKSGVIDKVYRSEVLYNHFSSKTIICSYESIFRKLGVIG
jgi:glycosyltransferase involved in cell wall biosynthesis